MKKIIAVKTMNEFGVLDLLMKRTPIIILMIFNLGLMQAQDIDTFILKYGVSEYDTIIYKRIIEFDKKSKIYQIL